MHTSTLNTWTAGLCLGAPAMLALLLVSNACSSTPTPDTGGVAGTSSPPVTAANAASSAAGMGAPAGRAAAAGGGAAGSASPAGVSAGTSSPTVTAGVSAAAAGAGAGSAAGTGVGGNVATAGASAGAGAAGAGGAAATGGCDRACLLAVMQTYLDALVAKDASKLKVSTTLKYTENGAVVKLGDGLWKTASALVPDERLDFADPTVGNVTSQLVVNESGTTPVIYMVRLKVVNQEITEIESMAVRQSGAANGFFNAMNLKPEAVFLQAIDPAKRMARADLDKITQLYLDYLEGKKDASMVPFDTNCKRYENGQATATGLASFQSQSWSFVVTRRILVIDEEAGIVWGMFPFSQAATALVVGEAFKIIDGKIMMIQAVMANMPATVWDMM
jgi:hypothetical protein